MIYAREFSRKLLRLSGVATFSLLCGRSAVAEESVAINLIEFETQNRNAAGVVRCGLFKEGGWLKNPVRSAAVRINKTTALCVFKEIPAGSYGISAFHDEDSNGKLNTNLIGYPIEEYCSSNNARNTFSPPSWKDAKFHFKGGTVRLRAVMK